MFGTDIDYLVVKEILSHKFGIESDVGPSELFYRREIDLTHLDATKQVDGSIFLFFLVFLQNDKNKNKPKMKNLLVHLNEKSGTGTDIKQEYTQKQKTGHQNYQAFLQLSDVLSVY